MRIPDLIQKKRDGGQHTEAELRTLILDYVNGQVPDYQVAAWLMAVFFKGMTAEETTYLTLAMAESGDMLDLSSLSHTVDKHSTGGVGDKTSLVLTPMLAALGLTVAKMSGRGLAHTGGTIDKLESIPGWSPVLADEPFLKQAREIGLALVGQSKNLAPADGLLYALRDVTATVDCLPLIASSIMSKKLAAGAKTIVLDVKVGSGAFMKTLEDGRKLAEAMVNIGKLSGRNVRAVLTDMETPLGFMTGNTLEVLEAISTLKGEGPEDLRELCLALAKETLLAEGFSEEEADRRPREVLKDGSALAKLRAFVASQGGDPRYIDDPSLFHVAPETVEVKAGQSGFIAHIEALKIGQALLVLGGGRETKGEAIDHSVGIELLHKIGDAVEAGQPIARIYHNQKGKDAAFTLVQEALRIDAAKPAEMPLILGHIS
ncbi:thymidine phosphorylase [Deinococcus cellulosilyticus]|uniref:Thymidine phosphorylase n=1 Tax=Deinococcus cellulosilyticus (strain DSM 18568 / NBRC 106333 / KACC 11606 / 5516J-15) TaxID=1223518 RepID=A0A511MVX6_DEIC1|nr:thymidine phosphorylase [Deinococcus cellulosilyticus]GEM44735.1 thymidine phosphorylase [Deinococcus cellulosilyticus NBRC 106333 = KACC 11606]